MTSNVTASVWELCEREKYRLQSIPGLTRIVDVCSIYGMNPATVCNIYYQWRKCAENESAQTTMEGIDNGETETGE